MAPSRSSDSSKTVDRFGLSLLLDFVVDLSDTVVEIVRLLILECWSKEYCALFSCKIKKLLEQLDSTMDCIGDEYFKNTLCQRLVNFWRI